MFRILFKVLKTRRAAKKIKSKSKKRKKKIPREFDKRLKDVGYTYEDDGYKSPPQINWALLSVVIPVLWDLIKKVWKRPKISSSIFGKLPQSNYDNSSEVEPINSQAIRYRKSSKGTYAVGSRHNNPMNVRPHKIKSGYDNTYWQGQQGWYSTDSSGDFVHFTDPFYSIRAAAISINNYKKNHSTTLLRYGLGRLTLRSLIYTYAPPKENETSAYLDFLVQRTGYHPDQEISMENKTQFIEVIKAMGDFESRAEFSREYLGYVWEAIFNRGPIPLQDIFESSPTTVVNTTVVNAYQSNKNLQNKV